MPSSPSPPTSWTPSTPTSSHCPATRRNEWAIPPTSFAAAPKACNHIHTKAKGRGRDESRAPIYGLSDDHLCFLLRCIGGGSPAERPCNRFPRCPHRRGNSKEIILKLTRRLWSRVDDFHHHDRLVARYL